MIERATVTVPADLVGVRADRVLAVLAGLSRSASRNLIEANLVMVGGVPIGRAAHLELGDVIDYPAQAPGAVLLPEPVPFSVVIELEDVLVVDKPAGVVVHPGAGHASGTLVNGLVYRFPGLASLGPENRWGLVHRLDRDTSGLLLVARSTEMHEFLQAELKERRVGRTYFALVSGRVGAATGTIDAPIGRDPARPTRMAVIQDGRPARTHYRRLAEWDDITLVEVELETGRTHQIRVHFASIGSGVIGDPVYGRRLALPGDLGRVWLHATRLRFPLRSGDQQEVSSPLPEDLRQSLASLGNPLSGEVSAF